jgi:ribosomal protein S18 acetylase RimI-like enzyme
MPEIEIRPAVSADLPILANIQHNFQTNYVWQMDRNMDEGQIAVNFREVRLPRTIRVEYPRQPDFVSVEWGQKSTILLACMAGSPVGYLRLRDNMAPNSAWITDLGIQEGLRRRGIATGLVLAAQEWALQRSLRRIVIEMQSKNHPAIRLAMKLGYEFCGFSDHYFNNQDIAFFFARFLR